MLAFSCAASVSGCGSTWFETDDWIADEVPLALEFNGISRNAVMPATPLWILSVALGFSLSGSIIDAPSCIQWLSVVDLNTLKPRGQRCLCASSLAIQLAGGAHGLQLCGTGLNRRAICQLLPDTPAISRGSPRMSASATLQSAGSHGAVHAAWCSPQGEVVCLREDVGRRNALDKLIGALALNIKVNAATGFVCVTSRASFEIVTASAGVLLAAVSADGAGDPDNPAPSHDIGGFCPPAGPGGHSHRAADMAAASAVLPLLNQQTPQHCRLK
jgi:FdhD protein